MKKGIVAGISLLLGASAGAVATEALQDKNKKKIEDDLIKMREFYDIFVRWLSIKQEGRSLVPYFVKNGYKTIAVYGMKELGERLYDELEDSEVKVQYVIDKNAEMIYAAVDVLTPEDSLAPVDAVVVTAVHYFDEIEAVLAEKMDCPILSLEDIIYEL